MFVLTLLSIAAWADPPPAIPEVLSATPATFECREWLETCSCDWRCMPADQSPAERESCDVECPERPALGTCTAVEGACRFVEVPTIATAWLSRATGAPQCTRPEQRGDYPTQASLLAELTAAGVEVIASAAGSQPVCSACGCPSGQFLKVQVAATAVESLTGSGWTQAE